MKPLFVGVFLPLVALVGLALGALTAPSTKHRHGVLVVGPG